MSAFILLHATRHVLVPANLGATSETNDVLPWNVAARSELTLEFFGSAICGG
jgi:hypothetical protein